jgi:hypothetical protein
VFEGGGCPGEGRVGVKKGRCEEGSMGEGIVTTTGKGGSIAV